MVINVITEGNHFVFLGFLGNGKEFQAKFFALCSKIFFAFFTIKFLPIIFLL